jgi:hypothetical protein
MKKIDISTPKYPNTFALVDDADFEVLSKYKWYATSGGDNKPLYAVCKMGDTGSKKGVRMHRFLLGFPAEGDHKDRDTLNNQRENLRACTSKQNSANTAVRKHSLSGYKGVAWEWGRNKWIARIRTDGKSRTIGRFTCLIKAAKAYDKAAKANRGEFAWLNFPD